MAQYGNSSEITSARPKNPHIYEKRGVNQESRHPLGALQSTIRGRLRFIYFGLIWVGVALFGLYAVFTDNLIPGVMDAFGGRTPFNILIVTVLLVGGIAWGLRLMNIAAYRIKLRRTGFEVVSLFGVKPYEYKDVDFYLTETMEHKYASDGYRPMLMKSQNYNWIWVCQVLFHDGRKPLEWKSSHYAWLKEKMRDLTSGIKKGAL